MTEEPKPIEFSFCLHRRKGTKADGWIDAGWPLEIFHGNGVTAVFNKAAPRNFGVVKNYGTLQVFKGDRLFFFDIWIDHKFMTTGQVKGHLKKLIDIISEKDD